MPSVCANNPLDETCPLLVEAQTQAKPHPTPIPIGQLAALCTVRLVEPIAFTQLFPYVNEFMSDLHLTDDPSRVGFYSGLVVCYIPICASNTFLTFIRKVPLQSPNLPPYITGLAFLVCLLPSRSSCAHFPLRRHWTSSLHPCGYPGNRGRYTDVRIVKIAGSSAHYSVHRSVSLSPFALLANTSTGGLASGNIAVIHSVLGEITDASNQAVVFPIYGIIWPLGSIIGLVR